MIGKLSLIGIYLCFLIIVEAIPKPEETKQKFEHETFKDHIENKEHDAEYDHEAFLGKDESKTFDQLSPEESKRRLLVIAEKIDNNKDGFVDKSELKAWIQYSQRRYIDEDVQRQWKTHNTDGNETVHWDIYRKNVYGFMDEMDPNDLEKEDDGFSYKAMLSRDRRRWSIADKNADDELTVEEFTAFLHPEEVPMMKDVVLTETIEDIDKNKDGKISANEYIADLYKSSDDDEEEPEWVLNERNVFTQFRDTNHDGYLDRDEAREWITPKDFDHADAEARHLISEADVDNDEKLTKDEILEKYDVFVGSQATDFGDALTRHDEF